MVRFVFSVILFCGSFGVVSVSMAVCQSDGRFEVKADGTILDKKSGLQWMRCPLGMELDGQEGSCSGAASRYSWFDARNEVAGFNRHGFAGKRDWRMPQIDELMTLVDKGCFNPAIVNEVFPRTPPSAFWAVEEVAQEQPRTWGWVAHFYHGSQYVSNKAKEWPVRLVRGQLGK